MKNYSIWKDNLKLKKFSKLDKDLDVDVLIIGGGITGISILYYLMDSNLKVALVEQNKIGMGVTANSTGKLTYLQDSIYNKLIKNFNIDIASCYLDSQKEAIQLAKEIIRKEDIDCDLVKTNSYVYTNQNKEIKNLQELRLFLEGNGVKVFEDNNSFVDSKYMIGVKDTYLFHPVKFVYGLLDNISLEDIYENTSIINVEKDADCYISYTSDNIIRSKWVILASHYPYFNLPFLFPIKGNLEKSYLSASRKKMDDISLISYGDHVVSVRSYSDYLIYLSNSHNISNNVDDKKHFDELLKKVSDLEINPLYLWSNIDIMTNDSLPYVGEIDDRLVIATGYNTWGMTNGILAGKIISDLVGGRDNKYLALFNPRRKNIVGMGMSVIDDYYSVNGYIKGAFTKSDSVEYRVISGIKVAIYRDNKGEHVVIPKCPHMGCSLIFNEVEKTWDCPCHASRFNLDGKCISGPANRDITFRKK